ncbi:MAG: urease accessory protein UreE [Termitinemataceae bacterium]|nr:MAG: urease accessory protein UreE [Termitinemataceae bacterium]
MAAKGVVFCEKVCGNVADFPGKAVDYVTVEWHEIRKRVHRKISIGGADVAIQLGDDAMVHPLKQDDVLAVQDGVVFAVDIPPCEVLVIRVDAHHERMAEKVCWEIGNKHAPLFLGEAEGEFITPYDMPIENLLGKFSGVSVEKDFRKLDISRSVSSSAGHHEH